MLKPVSAVMLSHNYFSNLLIHLRERSILELAVHVEYVCSKLNMMLEGTDCDTRLIKGGREISVRRINGPRSENFHLFCDQTAKIVDRIANHSILGSTDMR
jgi:hypothetical protein